MEPDQIRIMKNESDTENNNQIKTHKTNSKPWSITTASVAYVYLAAPTPLVPPCEVSCGGRCEAGRTRMDNQDLP